jgi:hypothetical protein
MKKFLVSTMMFLVVAIGLPLTAEAHPGCRLHRRYASRSYASRYYTSRYVTRRVYVPRYASTRYYAPRYRTARYYSSPRYATTRYYSPRYSTASYSAYRRPSYYRRHRNFINMAAGTGGGAILGALLGGRRGAGIGALAGLGGSALYTYKLNPKRRRY